jgi:hypothetical protein
MCELAFIKHEQKISVEKTRLWCSRTYIWVGNAVSTFAHYP